MLRRLLELGADINVLCLACNLPILTLPSPMQAHTPLVGNLTSLHAAAIAGKDRAGEKASALAR
eukprot:764504-Hanusia_phi.AAC.4